MHVVLAKARDKEVVDVIEIRHTRAKEKQRRKIKSNRIPYS